MAGTPSSRRLARSVLVVARDEVGATLERVEHNERTSDRQTVVLDLRASAGASVVVVPADRASTRATIVVIEPTLLDEDLDERLAGMVERGSRQVIAIVSGIVPTWTKHRRSRRLLTALGMSDEHVDDLPELDLADLVRCARRRLDAVPPQIADERAHMRIDALVLAIDGRFSEALELLEQVMHTGSLDEPVSQLMHDLDLAVQWYEECDDQQVAVASEAMRVDAARRIGSPIAEVIAARVRSRGEVLDQRSLLALERALMTQLDEPLDVDSDAAWSACRAAHAVRETAPSEAVAHAERALTLAEGRPDAGAVRSTALEMLFVSRLFAGSHQDVLDAISRRGVAVAYDCGLVADVVLFERLGIFSLLEKERFAVCGPVAERIDALLVGSGVQGLELRAKARLLVVYVDLLGSHCAEGLGRLDAVIDVCRGHVGGSTLAVLEELRLRILLEVDDHETVRRELERARPILAGFSGTSFSIDVLDWRCRLLDPSNDPVQVVRAAALLPVDVTSAQPHILLWHAIQLVEWGVLANDEIALAAAKRIADAVELDPEGSSSTMRLRELVLTVAAQDVERIEQQAVLWKSIGNAPIGARVDMIHAVVLGRLGLHRDARASIERAHHVLSILGHVHAARIARVVRDDLRHERSVLSRFPRFEREHLPNQFGHGLQALSRRGAMTVFAHGTTLDAHGSRGVWIIVSGVLVLTSTDHEERIHEFAPAGSVLHDDVMYAGEWRAHDDVTAVFVPREIVSEAMRANDEVSIELVRAAETNEARVRAVSRIRGAGMVHDRVVLMLQHLAGAHGRPTLDGGTLIDVRMTQIQFATLVAATRQAVGPILRGLSAANIIARRRGRYVILDVDALRARVVPQPS